MSKELALAATVATGGLVAVQAPMNATLAKSIGNFGSGMINMVVGAVAMVAIVFLLAGGLQTAGNPAPWYVWIFGGLAGAAYVTTALASIPALGAGGVTAATIAGQLTLSVIVDRAGILGLDERAITREKLIGIALLAAGTLLIVRE
jgi:transporter family-2 protein